jgi:hypothetical protein
MSVDRSDMGERIDRSRAILGHPMDMYPEPTDALPVQEGTHYEVIAYADWTDLFYPTVVVWDFGTDTSEQAERDRCYDDFTDLERSARLRRHAERVHSEGER